MSPRLFQLASAAIVIVVSMLCVSCSSSVAVYPVSGRMLIDGRPASGMVIALRPLGSPVDAEEWSVQGGVDSAGDLILRTYKMPGGKSPRLGAPEGEYVLTVSCPDSLEQFDEAIRDGVNARYSNPKTSSLRVTIKPGPNDLGVITLSKEHPSSGKEN